MTVQIYIGLLLFAFSCSHVEEHENNSDSATAKKSEQLPGPMTKEFSDVDTLIEVRLFNLKPYEVVIGKFKKKNLVTAAINSAFPDFIAERFLEFDCWCIDPVSKMPYEDTVTKAPDCRLSNFHFIDVDNDGDLDILYSSLADQYAQSDTNEFILLQNNNGKYKKFGINGYLYDADFSKKADGRIVFRTVSRPCCEYFYYNFSETVFSATNWTFDTKHVLEIQKLKVRESY
jgi:hypothetical protein